jgi:two-component system sensor histidine kinase ArlS
MNKNLLHKTQRAYLYFLILLFVIVAPLFFIIAHRLYVEEVDESLMLAKSEFLQHSVLTLETKDIADWNRFNDKIKIEESKGLSCDTLFYISYYNFLEKENEPYRELNSPVVIDDKPYTLSLKTNLLESEDLIITILLLFITIIAFSFLGILLINKWLSTRLWKPFYQTLQQIEHFEIDKNRKPNFSRSNITEFNSLNSSIEKLIERNIVIYNNQREFVENAAHELQTPIAVFKAKIDTLIQRADVTRGQSEILVSLNDAISRLNRLNKNLLLLSKIEKQQFNQTETVSINKLIENQLDFFTEQAKQKGIKIGTAFKNDIVVNTNIGLTEIMINNLLLNAIRHNINDGEINISILEQSLIISNTGKVGRLSEEKLFSRFSKANTSKQGNGLGLAIVKKIADLNRWSVSYSYSEQTHTFLLQF